jgi:hypothetical protein
MRLVAVCSLAFWALTAGCSKPPEPPMPTPPPDAQANAEALKKKIEELKKSNPNLPPAALGTMAAKMLQQEQQAGRR